MVQKTLLALAAVLACAASWEGPFGGKTQQYLEELAAAKRSMAEAKSRALAGWNEATVAASNAARTSKCIAANGVVSCRCSNTTMDGRWVGWQVPDGEAPSGGWPSVIVFHGLGLLNSEYCWFATTQYSYGLYFKAETVETLLSNGFMVITPDANETLEYWLTNTPQYATPDLAAWNTSDDDVQVRTLVARCKAGYFGPCNPNAMHAIGFSSGGYMTGRAAVNYALPVFKSLTVIAGSFYYCYGEYCSDQIADETTRSVWGPKSHPPTRFLHGSNDSYVPFWSSAIYQQYLTDHNVTNDRLTTNLDHQWPPRSADNVLTWVTKWTS